MKVAITGANGFLGGYIVNEYLKAGTQVISLVRKGASLSLLPTHDLLAIEYIDYNRQLDTQFEHLLSKYGPLDYFIHNAGVTVSLDNEEYFNVNVGLTSSLIEAAQTSRWLSIDGKWIQISSMAAQGPFGVGKPVSNYGRSKLEAEALVQQSEYSSVIFRPTGIYGPGDLAFLPLFQLAVKGIYPVTNKHQKMSMIHAKDLAKIIYQESIKEEGIIHVNDGNTYLHQDFITILKEVTQRNIRKMPTPVWISKISLGISDIWHRLVGKRPGLTLEKFQEISMNWHLHEDPELTFSKVPCEISLKEGFENTFNYYKNKQLL